MAENCDIFIWETKNYKSLERKILKDIFEIETAEITRYSLVLHIIALHTIYRVHITLLK
jgi:hypothetical protein